MILTPYLLLIKVSVVFTLQAISCLSVDDLLRKLNDGPDNLISIDSLNIYFVLYECVLLNVGPGLSQNSILALLIGELCLFELLNKSGVITQIFNSQR